MKDEEFRVDYHKLLLPAGSLKSGLTEAGREAMEKAVDDLIAMGELARCPFCGYVSGIEEGHPCPIFAFKTVTPHRAPS